MKACETIKKVPLGVPMTVAAVGTLATLLGGGKALHVGCGLAWAGLSLWHGLQHSGKMQIDFQEQLEKFCENANELKVCVKEKYQAKKEQLEVKKFVNSFEVASFVPGRVRLYSLELAAKPELKEQVEEYVRSFTGVTSAVVNPTTGSLLIKYMPSVLHTKPALVKIEEYFSAKAPEI